MSYEQLKLEIRCTCERDLHYKRLGGLCAYCLALQARSEEKKPNPAGGSGDKDGRGSWLKLELDYPVVPPRQTTAEKRYSFVLPDRSVIRVDVIRINPDSSGHTVNCTHYYWDYLEWGLPKEQCTCGANSLSRQAG